MECREVRPLAEAFVTGALSTWTIQAMGAHMDRCAGCRSEIDAVRRLRLATRTAFTRTPSLMPRAGFVDTLTARLRSLDADHQQRGLRRVWRPFLALAAGILVLAGGAGMWQSPSSRSLALLHTVVRDHLECAITFKPVRHFISLDEASRRYGGIYGRLDRIEPVTTPTGNPLRIVGRHSCVFDGRRFAHIVLRYKDDTVSLLVADDSDLDWMIRAMRTGGSGSSSSESLIDGYHIARFAGGRHQAFVVSSLSEDEMRDVVAALQPPVLQALRGA